MLTYERVQSIVLVHMELLIVDDAELFLIATRTEF